MIFETTGPEETRAAARQVAALLRPGDPGENAYGPPEPFALVHQYDGPLPLCHFDMFRVTTLEDLYSTGFFDYLEGGAVLAVEWSENIQEALPRPHITVEIAIGEGDRRTITVTGDERFL